MERIAPHDQNGFPLEPASSQGIFWLRKTFNRKRISHRYRHHLFFSAARFKKEPRLLDLRENCLASVVMDFEEHQKLHDNFDDTPIPDQEKVEMFLQEAALVKNWIGSVNTLRKMSAKCIFVTNQAVERALEIQDDTNQLAPDLSDFRAIPNWIRQAALEHAHQSQLLIGATAVMEAARTQSTTGLVLPTFQPAAGLA